MLLFSLCALGTALTAARVWLVTRMSPLWRGRTGYATWAVQAVVLVLLSGIETAVIGVCANAPALAMWWRRRGGRPLPPPALSPLTLPLSPQSPTSPVYPQSPASPVFPRSSASSISAKGSNSSCRRDGAAIG
jgi:hypothetical protein